MIRIQRASADALFDLRELLLHLEPLTVHLGRVGDEGKSARIGLLDDPQDLRKAHESLDKVVDAAFGAAKPCKSNDERLQILFDRYAEMTQEQ